MTIDNLVLDTIRKRRSVRRFRDLQIPDETLRAIVEAGDWAPSACNDQSWHFTLLQDRQLMDRISVASKEALRRSETKWMVDLGNNPDFHVFYRAPTVLIASYRENAVDPHADLCAAVENILLAAWSLGVGSCWVGLARGFLSSPEAPMLLELPQGYKAAYAVALGFPFEATTGNGPARKSAPFHWIKEGKVLREER